MFSALIPLIAVVGNPITGFTTFIASQLATLFPLAVGVMAVIFLIKHKIRDLIILLITAGIVASSIPRS
ncbi:hypothetical protein [Sulfobacillus thermosulfidooxidans]|uniref:hypothetical protein n=1 Tax=Sulfobacillus thermosulfidooxidans TaxID=28034 RepID=UPI0006B52BD1|nr:hypothetical protein [Sulfobacillus thermosulfidooxidans]